MTDIDDVGLPPGLSESEAADLKGVYAELAREFEIRAVLGTGSFSIGMGNSTSDVDLIVLVPEDAIYPHSLDFVVGNRTCDIEFATEASLRGYWRTLEQLRLHHENYSDILRVRPALRFAGRLRHSRILYDVIDLAAWRQSLDFELLERLYMTYWSADCIRLTRDVVGALEAGDGETAAEASWRALWAAAETLVPMRHLTYLADKLLYRRLEGSVSEELREEIRVLMHSVGHDGSLAALAETRLRVAAQCTALSGLRLPSIQSRDADTPSDADAPQRWQRAPGFVSCWLEDQVVIAGPRLLVVPRAVAAVWGHLEGRTTKELAAQLTARTGAEQAKVIVERSLRSLEHAGLASQVTTQSGA